MKDYLAVLKIILKNNFRSSRNKYLESTDDKAVKKRKITRAVNIFGVCLGLIVTMAMMYLIVHIMSMLCAVEGISVQFLSMLLTAGQIIIIFFGMSSVLSNTFFAKDNEFLASLPVKPEIIFAAKITVIYLNELIVSSLFLTPILAAFISGSVVGGFPLPLYFYFMIPLIYITEPIVPLVIISLLSFPMIKVVSYFKNKSAVTLVASILLFAAFMSLYMVFVPNIEKFVTITGQASLLTPMLIKTITGIGKAIFYNNFFALALTGTRFWANIVIFFATVAVSSGVTAATASVLYHKAVGASGEETRQKVNVSLTQDVDSLKKALFKREWNCLIRNQSFAFNSVMGSVITPIIILLMNFIGAGDIFAATGATSSEFARSFSATGFVLFYSLLLLCGTNYTAALAFSREGDTFYVLRYLPVKLKDIVSAKLNLANAVSVVGVVLTAIVMLAALRVGILNVLPLTIVSALYCCAFNTVFVYRDLKKPNVNWTSPYEVIKKNVYPMIPMFGAMILGIVYMVLASLIARYEYAVKLSITVSVFWVVVLAVGVIILLVARYKLNRDQQAFFDRVNYSS